MRFNTLQQWLDWQESLHLSEIELGLERVGQVYQCLHSQAFPIPVITVAGTNGKGSSVAMLESIYSQAGYRVGSYTSPHLYHYNERIRLNQTPVDDDLLCESFARIDEAREKASADENDSAISLTYFEFGTLAAFDIFHRAVQSQTLDVIVLEVGLGGRLDAVNLVDANVALITSIGLDHTNWLGDTREAIGYEKAGIMRANQPVVCSDTEMPESILEYANSINAPLYQIGKAFNYQLGDIDWQWSSDNSIRTALPRPALIGEHQYRNAAGVLQVIALLQGSLPVSQSHVRQGLMDVRVDGRCQVVQGNQTIILDVSHNAESIYSLAQIVREMQKSQLKLNKLVKVHAIVGMMKDKAIEESLSSFSKLATQWYLIKPPVERAAEAELLESIVVKFKPQSSQCFANLEKAFVQCQTHAAEGDIIVVFGSFHTVSAFQLDWICS